MVILTLDTTTRVGSCAVWRGDGIVDEMVGNPEYTHAHRLPNDLAKILANQRLRLKDVTLYAIAHGPGSFTGLRVGISTMQSLALVHDRRIVPISSLEALAYCGAREDPTRAQPGTCIGSWMEAYRGEVFCALYRVVQAPMMIESTDPHAGEKLPERVPASIVPLPAYPPKRWLSLAKLEPVMAPAVGTPESMANLWAMALTSRAILDAPYQDVVMPPVIVIGDAAHANRALLSSRLPKLTLLDHVPIAGILAELAAREPQRGVMPHELVPFYLRAPLAEITRERVEAMFGKEEAKAAQPEWRRHHSGNGSGNGNGNGTH